MPLSKIFGPQTAGSGNATVPGTAPFLPAQAFVDNITQFANPNQVFAGGQPIVLTGISSITFSADPTNPDADKGDAVLFNFGNLQLTFSYDFTSSPLVVTTVNSLLAFWRANNPNFGVLTIDLTGMPAAPTGQGIADNTYLNNIAGWTITTN